KKGVVSKFVEFYGPGLSALALPDRATISNMSPEYGATIGFFPVDAETLAYLRFTGRSPDQIALVEAYCKEQGLFRTDSTPDPVYSDALELDLAQVEPSLAGPRRPQDRLSLRQCKRVFRQSLLEMIEDPNLDQERVGRWLNEGGSAAGLPKDLLQPELGKLVHFVPVKQGPLTYQLGHGAVVIAAITSCTNTSNPAVMLAAGLLAKKAVERGLSSKPWVKTSLAPGSQVVSDYLKEAGLTPYLDKLKFHLVGYGCTTCIGNSGPLPPSISKAIEEGGLVAAAVLSGNRNFEGRINPDVRANYLASPPLVVAYSLAGRIDIDLTSEPLGAGKDGKPVYLKEIWPSLKEINETMQK